MPEKPTRDRVKLTFWRERSTLEGLILIYLDSHHPFGTSTSEGVMDTLLKHWLPIVLKENGRTKEEYQKVAAYSVQQLLAQVEWIKAECGLLPLSLSERESDRYVSSKVNPSNELSKEDDEDDSWIDEPDDSGIDLSDMVIDAGFRS